MNQNVLPPIVPFNELPDYELPTQPGMPPLEEAKRDNAGKTPYANLPLDLLDGAACAMHYGELKYGRENYRKGYRDLFKPLDSLMRHVTAVQRALSAEDKTNAQMLLNDSASGLPHIHHVITSAMLLLNAMRKHGWKV